MVPNTGPNRRRNSKGNDFLGRDGFTGDVQMPRMNARTNDLHRYGNVGNDLKLMLSINGLVVL